MSAAQRATNYFDRANHTLYRVSGVENRERMEDIMRAARAGRIRIRRVNDAWVRYMREHDPFAREIDLTEKAVAA